MDQRVQFIADSQRDVGDAAGLARRYGISRTTADQWIDRYDVSGPTGLVDRSRRPARAPLGTPAAIVATLVALRRHHPAWGAQKRRTISPSGPWTANFKRAVQDRTRSPVDAARVPRRPAARGARLEDARIALSTVGPRTAPTACAPRIPRSFWGPPRQPQQAKWLTLHRAWSRPRVVQRVSPTSAAWRRRRPESHL